MWRLLHSVVERLGKQESAILIGDELRAWVNFLKAVEFTIPCQKCRSHYRSWRIKNRIEKFLIASSLTIRSEARAWVWGLHSEVNEERRVANVALSLIPSLYEKRTSLDITRDAEECITAFQNAVQQSFLPAEGFRNFKFTLSRLRVLTS